MFKNNDTFKTLKINNLKWFGLTSFLHFKAKLYHTKCLNKKIVNDVTLVRDDNIQIKPHKNVQVGSMGNRDKETKKMANCINLVCDDDTLIKIHTKVLWDGWVT